MSRKARSRTAKPREMKRNTPGYFLCNTWSFFVRRTFAGHAPTSYHARRTPWLSSIGIVALNNLPFDVSLMKNRNPSPIRLSTTFESRSDHPYNTLNLNIILYCSPLFYRQFKCLINVCKVNFQKKSPAGAGQKAICQTWNLLSVAQKIKSTNLGA